MIVFANAKINIGLHLINKRNDGYHNIETVFFPIGWSDILEIIPSDTFLFEASGLPIQGTTESNLCVKAYQLMQQKYALGPVSVHLHKVIPMGAGLGGGSSDAAYTLIALNDLFQLHLSQTELLDLAQSLGSDCAFFIKNTPVFATEKGNYFTHIDLTGLHSYNLLVVYPNLFVSTAQAYRNCVPRGTGTNLYIDIQNAIEVWPQNIHNDFEKTIFALYPVLEDIKKQLYRQGAIYASMSGSGSALYGVFPSPPDVLWWQSNFPTYMFWTQKMGELPST